MLCRRVEVRCAGADHRDSAPLICALTDTPCHPPAEQTGLQSLRNTKMKIRIICAVARLCRVLLSRGGNSGNGKQGLMAERAANYVQELEQGINQSSLAPSARFVNASIAVYLQEHKFHQRSSY